MRVFSDQWLKAGVANWLVDNAYRQATLDMARHQPANRLTLEACTAQHRPSGTQLMLTRESGYHSSGWWKNPDYERCLHLSICYRAPDTGDFIGSHDFKLSRDWVELVFRDNVSLTWHEGPQGPEGKKCAVHHWRLFFVDTAFRVPLLPRGEVYTREHTVAGWESWSDVQARLDAEEARRREVEGNP